MTAARILTVRQPWAWAIVHGGKTVENRVRNIAGDYRGPVLIHASKSFDDSAWATVEGLSQKRFMPEVDVRGAIIGLVDLVDVHSASVMGGCGRMRHDCPVHGTCREHCSIWAQGPSPDGWFQHLVFENPRALDAPIPYAGALGLRKTDFGIEGDWLVEYHEPCKSPCAGTEYGCPPSCHMDPVARLVATS